MDYLDKLSGLLEQPLKSVFLSFLNFLKEIYVDFLEGNLTDLQVSDITVEWFVINENFSDSLVNIDKRIRQLRAGLDLTHTDISENRKKLIIKDMLEIVEEMIKDYEKEHF